MSEIRIVAELEVLPEHREALMPVLRSLVNGSRAEVGNRVYDLTEDIADPCHFFVIETWASQQALEEHNATPHFRAFVSFVEGKTRPMAVTLLKNVF